MFEERRKYQSYDQNSTFTEFPQEMQKPYTRKFYTKRIPYPVTTDIKFISKVKPIKIEIPIFGTVIDRIQNLPDVIRC